MQLRRHDYAILANIRSKNVHHQKSLCAIVTPTYQYWYIGYANRVKGEFVNMTFLEQVEKGSSRFSDKNCRENKPIAHLFHKLSTASQSVSKYRSKTQRVHEKDFVLSHKTKCHICKLTFTLVRVKRFL